MLYRGFKITVFQQFRGVWLARYEVQPDAGADVAATCMGGAIGGATKRSVVAMCKAEVFHIHRSARIRASSDAYYAKLSRRFRLRWSQRDFGRTG